MIVRMYRKMYTTLFNAVTEALELIARAQYIDAEAVLKKAQLETEQTFIFWEEQDVSPLPAQQELVFKEDLGDACGGECGGVQVILGGAPVEGLPDVGELCGDCEAWAPPAIAGELDGEESGPA